MRKTQKSKKDIAKELKVKKYKKEIIVSILTSFSSLVFSCASFVRAIDTEQRDVLFWLFVIFSFIAFFVSIYSFVLLCSNYRQIKKYQKELNYYSESKRISDTLLTAIKRVEFEKTSSILRSTYGTVPKWHPINYNENVLIYDVHEHLRKICVEIKQMIVSLAPDEFNDDMVTVDIAFNYPSDNQFIVLENKMNDATTERTCSCVIRNEQTDGHKIITSGDRTSLDVHLHTYLNDKGSFYHHLNKVGYEFANNKEELTKENHYLWTTKDNEYKKIGSIVGSVVQLKNDNPELTFVSAYVTVSTYGRRFIEDSDILDIDTFEKLFKATVINSFKTIIETELAHMFIRHGIRNHIIDKETGRMELKPSCDKRGQEVPCMYLCLTK